MTKLVYVRLHGADTSSKAFDGVFTLFNGSRRVVGQWLVRSTSTQEIRVALQGVAKRFKDYGFKGPLLYSTDNCCHEHDFLCEVFETLRDNQVDLGVVEDECPPLELPANVRYLQNYDDVDAAAKELLAQVEANQLTSIGFDLEWQPFVNDPPVAIVQLATTIKGGGVYIIAFHQLERVPKSLKDLLKDPRVVKCGVGIKGDATRLAKPRNHGLEVTPLLDLRGRAKELKICPKRATLEDLTAEFLGKGIPGKRTVRLSDWATRRLSQAQLDYAARDAYACALLVKHLEEAAAFAQVPSPTSLTPGKQVSLYNRGGQRVAAIGTIEERADCHHGRRLNDNDVLVRVLAVTVPSTRLCYGKGKVGDVEHQTVICWDRRRLRIARETEQLRAWKHLVGCQWHDPGANNWRPLVRDMKRISPEHSAFLFLGIPNPRDKGSFIIVDIKHSEDGILVLYRNADDDFNADSYDEGDLERSLLKEVLRWLNNDFSSDDADDEATADATIASGAWHDGHTVDDIGGGWGDDDGGGDDETDSTGSGGRSGRGGSDSEDVGADADASADAERYSADGDAGTHASAGVRTDVDASIGAGAYADASACADADADADDDDDDDLDLDIDINDLHTHPLNTYGEHTREDDVDVDDEKLERCLGRCLRGASWQSRRRVRLKSNTQEPSALLCTP